MNINVYVHVSYVLQLKQLDWESVNVLILFREQWCSYIVVHFIVFSWGIFFCSPSLQIRLPQVFVLSLRLCWQLFPVYE